MKQIFGLLIIFISNLVFSSGSHHEKIVMSPSTPEVIHYVNDSHIVTCIGHKETKVRWLNPRGQAITEKKGRVHVEEMSSGQLALVFEHIALSDKGTWSCVPESGEGMKTFKMFINQPISFMDTPIVQTAREGVEATIRCEVKGDPNPKISWSFNGQLINLPHPKFTKLADGLSINKVTKNDSGEYTCRAYQISEKINEVEEKIIRLNIQHKPIASQRKASANIQYGYVHGNVNLTCEAEAEPQANFTWFRHGTKISPKLFPIYTGNHTSMLQIYLNDSASFGDYKCKATNSLGTLDRVINLQEGIKPEPPTQFVLRGVNSDTFDIDVGAVRSSNVRHNMDINGYRFEIISEHEFRNNGGRWDTARVLVVGFEDGMTYLINNLASNTTYLVRVASRNPAGYSDWTETKTWSTYPKEPIMFGSSGVKQIVSPPNSIQILSTIGFSLLLTQRYSFDRTSILGNNNFLNLNL